MSIEIKVPVLPESVSDATLATWHKKPGESVKRDEHLLDIETDKIILEVVAPDNGYIEKILKNQGETVKGEELVALFSAAAADLPFTLVQSEQTKSTQEVPLTEKDVNLAPAVRRLVSSENIKVDQIQGSGRNGRVTTEDVKKSINTKENKSPDAMAPVVTSSLDERSEKRVPMNRLRARIAERLLQAQHSAAILTTFNEINMQPVMELRKKYKDTFEKDYGVRLGLMSFFVIAIVEALKRFPIINASVEGNDIIYHGYFDIGIAINSNRGLVVPIVRNAEHLNMAEIEKQIAVYRDKAQEGRLTIEEMTGGTFTISNGGVLGSLLSTPIINPPQSAILGMHKIEDRPIVEDGTIVIRPMMYLALSYDHRIIDGGDSVRFLVTVKELLEDPARLLLNV